ncbi:MAG: 4-hydroxy-tetrahydrodipicolinate reductase [Legionellales bacterium]|nr:4-hydroxy-tetrahydrodipicolinate reductase [Legionellales bacterium]
MSISTPIRVLVIGHLGKMGRIAIEAIESNPQLIYAGGCGRGQSLEEAIRTHQPMVGLDLTTPQTVLSHVHQLIDAGIHPVVGTSGLSALDIESLQHLCSEKQLGAMIVPNFSIGACLMMHCASLAAQFFTHAAITETHHLAKKDAPSGTALATADRIAQARKQSPTPHHSSETHPGSLGAQYREVPIHSLRLPSSLASQSVYMAQSGESLTLTHDSHDRSCFIPGISMACEQVVSLKRCMIGLDSLLGLTPFESD